MLEERIDAWIETHREELLEDIARLVRIPSVSVRGEGPQPYGAACAQALEEMLAMGERYGFKTENADGRCGVIRFGGQGGTIGLWGHLDVVPAGNDWHYPPFSCTREGDFLIGRGVQDNKGPCVAVLYAMRCLRELGLPLRAHVQQVVGCAEETGMEDAVYFRDHFPVPELNLITDCGFPVCYGEKGILTASLGTGPLSGSVLSLESGSVSNIVPDLAVMKLRAGRETLERARRLPQEIEWRAEGEALVLTAHGISGHAAFPAGTVNAADRLCRAVLDAGLLEERDRAAFAAVGGLCATTDGSALSIACKDDLSGELTCVAGVIALKDRCLTADINVRYPVSADPDELIRSLTERAARDGLSVLSCKNDGPNWFDPASPYVRLLTDVYNRVTGSSARPFVMGGGTYARKLPSAMAFGPGMSTDLSPLGLPPGHGGCHAPDEAQSVSNLLKAVKIYVLALLELDAAM